MTKPNTRHHFTHWFREAAPYIQAHRGKTAVVCLPGEALADDNVAELLSDIAGISHLGMHIVLAYGVRPQVEACLGQQQSNYEHGLRVTDDRAMACVAQQSGMVGLMIESSLSRALATIPLRGAYATTASGNFITARPYGVHDGIDFKHTGVVRRVNAAAIRHQLDGGAIVLASPIGFSPTGETFNLAAGDVAATCATALAADKLVVYTNKSVSEHRQLTAHEARALLDERKPHDEIQKILRMSLQATALGVHRVHILNWREPAAILQELFTRDGIGTLISAEPYDTIRAAHSEDIPGILQIIEALERDGILVRRQRDALEMEIGHFLVAVRDSAVIGCAAVYPYPQHGMAELACLAMRPDYRGNGGGEQLLNAAQQQAKEMGLQKMFVLTTQTAHWFTERGFRAADIAALPSPKQRLYNYQRQAKVFIKPLTAHDDND